MKIKALSGFTAFTGEMVVFNKDDTGDLPDHMAKTYIDGGLAVAVGDADDEPAAAAEPEPGDDAEGEDEDDISSLRAEYEEVVGKRPFNGWDADTLRAKMAEASGSDEDAPAA